MKYENKSYENTGLLRPQTPKERRTSGVSKTQTTETSNILPNALFEAVNLITLNTL